MEENILIEIKSLSKRFGDVTAIDDLSLSFEGKVLGVCGAKNSGKTVLLNIICGIVPPSEGEALVFGENLWKPKRNYKNKNGYFAKRRLNKTP